MEGNLELCLDNQLELCLDKSPEPQMEKEKKNRTIYSKNRTVKPVRASGPFLTYRCTAMLIKPVACVTVCANVAETTSRYNNLRCGLSYHIH
jgi:hypothetical protein